MFDLNVERMFRLGRLRLHYKHATTMPAKWQAIRAIYREVLPDIFAVSQGNIRGWVDPYFLDWDFSPIERDAWHSIRYHGTPLYPQVPVAGFFVDFGSPYLRVGVELDGKDYHDPAKDAQRDRLMAQQGWRIFRIQGMETMTKYELPTDWETAVLSPAEYHEVRRWFFESSDGVIAAIDRVYFHPHPWEWPYFDMALHTLNSHRFASFDVMPSTAIDAELYEPEPAHE